MDLTYIKTPKHVVGKSLVPIMKNVNATSTWKHILGGGMDTQLRLKDIDLLNGELMEN